MKRKPPKWETIIANYTSDRSLISRIYIDVRNRVRKTNDSFKENDLKISQTWSLS